MKDIMEHSGFVYQGYIPRKKQVKLTVKEWKRFDKVFTKQFGDTIVYLDMQQLLCKKYDVILTDHRTRGEKLKDILKKFNQKNLDKGINMVQGGIDDFVKEIDNFGSAFGGKDEALTKELLGISKGKKKPSVKIWSDSFDKPKTKSRRKGRKTRVGRHEQNMKKIWGKRY